MERKQLKLRDVPVQVWDLLSEGGKSEAELVKATSGAGFNVPDLTQIGKPPFLSIQAAVPNLSKPNFATYPCAEICPN